MKICITFFLLLISCLTSRHSFGQNMFKLSGQVLDENGKYLPLVNVSIQPEIPGPNQLTLITPTRNYGRFNFSTLEEGRYILEARFLGYKTLQRKIKITRNQHVTLRLYPTFETLDEITIQTDKKEKEKNTSSRIESTSSKISKSTKEQLHEILNFIPGLSWFGTGFALSPNVLEGETLNRMIIVENDIQQIPIHWGLDRGREFDLFGIEGIDHVIGPNGYQYGSSSGSSLIRLKQQVLPEPLSLFGNIMVSARDDNRTRGLSILSSARTHDFYIKGRASLNLHGDIKTKAKFLHYGDKLIEVDKTFENTAKTDWSMMVLGGITKQWGKSELTIKNTFRQQGLYPQTYHATPSYLTSDENVRNIETPYYNALNLHIINNNKIYTKAGSVMVDLGYQYNEYQNWSNESWFTMPDSTTFDRNKEDLELQDKIQNISANLRIERLHGEKNAYKIGVASYRLSSEIDGFSYLLPSFTQQNLGVFAREQLYLGENIKFTVGARYDLWWLHTKETGYHYNNTHLSTEVSPTKHTSTYNENKSYDGFSYSLSADFTPNSNLNINLLSGKNLRLPTISELHSDGYNARTYRYEVGNAEASIEKSNFVSVNIDYNLQPFRVTVFSKYNHFDNYLYPQYSDESNLSPNNTNLPIINYCEGKAKKFNVNAEVSAYATSSIRFKVNGDYTYALIEKNSGNIPFPMIQLPKLFVECSYLPQQNFSVLEEMEIGLQLEKGFDQNHVPPNELKTPGFTTLNLAVGSYLNFGLERVRIDLQWKNILNKTYFDPTKFYRIIGIPEPSGVLYFTLNVPFQGLGKH